MKTKKLIPGTFIVTSDGKRGYVIDEAVKKNFYEVRLIDGYHIISSEDLKIDHLSENVKK